MASLLIGVFACVVMRAGAVSVIVDTKGTSQELPESTETKIIRKEDKGSSAFTDLLGEPTVARPSASVFVAPSWKPRNSYEFKKHSGDDEAAAMTRQSIENTNRVNSTYSFAQRAMRRSNAQKTLASKRAGSDKTKRDEADVCVNTFDSDFGGNCKEGKNIEPGASCTWDCEGASPQVSKCECSVRYNSGPNPGSGITTCELTPRTPVCAGICKIGEETPCKTRTIDYMTGVIASGESCNWEEPERMEQFPCPDAVPAQSKCKCSSFVENQGISAFRPDCAIEWPKCKGNCEAVFKPHAKCKEANAKGLILEGTKCTFDCEKEGEISDPKESTCKCTEKGCLLELWHRVPPLEADCRVPPPPPKPKKESSTCFPASAMILRPNGAQTNVAFLKQGDMVVGVTREWDLQDDTYLSEFHAGQSRQRSMHKFIEVQHLCQMGRPLRITAGHLLYAREAKQAGKPTQPELMPAGKLQPGIHEVFAIGCDKSQPRERLEPSLVLNITSVWAEGLYNPLTASRTAIVDGVATSNLALTSESIETAFNSSPFVRSIYEPAAWLLVAPVHLCAMLGLSTSWLSNTYLQDVVTSGLEKIAQLMLYAA